MKSQKRQLERLHKKTTLTVNLHAYTDYLHQYNNALKAARSNYYSQLIHSGSSNPKALFSTISTLLKPCDNATPSFTTSQCNSFLSFFQSKIDSIYRNLTSSADFCFSVHLTCSVRKIQSVLGLNKCTEIWFNV